MKKNLIILLVLVLVAVGLYFVSQQKEEKPGIVSQELVGFQGYVGPGCEVYPGCGPTQCGNIGDEQRGSICDARLEYQCLIGSTARCEKQPEGDCGWTQTEEFKQCVSDARTSENQRN